MSDPSHDLNRHSWYVSADFSAEFDGRFDQCEQIRAGLKPAFRATVGEKPVLIKSRPMGGKRDRLRRFLGHNEVKQEFDMTVYAANLGLPVAVPLGYTQWSRQVFTGRAALLIDWLHHYDKLRPWVVDNVANSSACADRTHIALVRRVESRVAKLFAEVRRANLADSDFGAHNIMFSDEDIEPTEFVWIDLEMAYHASVTDTTATVDMLASMLTNWWVVTAGQQERIQCLFAKVVNTCPEPEHKWDATCEQLNTRLAHTTLQRTNQGHVSCPAGRLTLP